MRLPLLLCLPALLALAILSGCAEAALSGSDSFNEDRGPTNGPGAGACFENTMGECVAATPGCDPSTIRGEGAQTCASCVAGGGAVEICGEPSLARCFDLESPGGGPCQRCVTDDGLVAYDDCFESPDDVADLTCEVVRRGDPSRAPDAELLICASDADCPDQHVCIAEGGSGSCVPLEEGVECEVCTDESGRIVREVCRPEADTCQEVVQSDGSVCTECTANGELAWRECTRADVDPSVCEVYGDEVARCVDCYGENDTLLTHDCSVGALDGAAGFCEVVTLPGGLECRTCYDERGVVLSDDCAEGPEPMRCEELVYTDQTCVVCVDDTSAPVLTDCRRNGCDPATECPPPAPCEMRSTPDGTLCRVCPVEGTGELEQRCLSGGDLFCFFEDQYSEPPPSDPDSGGEAPPPSAEVCMVCVDAEVGEEVYRNCGASGGAAPSPPVCMPSTTADGVECEVCYDSVTGEEVYSSCG